MGSQENPVAWATRRRTRPSAPGGRPIAGAARPPLEEAPPHWNVYFNVVDVDESVAQAEALGAKLIVPPVDLDGTGRMATLTDPHGAMFCLMAG